MISGFAGAAFAGAPDFAIALPVQEVLAEVQFEIIS